jgi:hypothetical protein
MVGSQIIVYINNQPYKVTQSLTFEVDYGEEAIYGIDTPYAQEIAGGRVVVRGSVKGLRIKNSGGLQGYNLRPLFTDLMASPYVSIRVADRTTGEDIVLVQSAKISNESHTASIKGSYKLNFDFVGQIPLFALDRAD